MKTILILAFGIMGAVVPGRISASESLSPEKLLSLMEASRSRYQNLETTIEMKEYRGNEIPQSNDVLIAGQRLSDQQLAEAALQAGNLALQNQKNTLTTAEEALFMQEYVWVLPGKNQYTLELAPMTKTKPVLVDKAISDSPMVLQSVEDQLATSGKLIVTLERPAGHKAFADAVLTLDFAGTKVPIHFVAAPLPE